MSGIFDGLYVDQLFHRNERGETIYYPYGLMGRGYLLPPEREAGVRQATRRLMFGALVLGIGFAVGGLRFTGPETAVSPLLVMFGGVAFLLLLGLITYLQSRLVVGLEPAAGPRPAVGEWLRRGRQARAPWTYRASLGLGLLTLLLAATGFAFDVGDGEPVMIVSGAVLFLVGALLTWDGAMGLIERSKVSKSG